MYVRGSLVLLVASLMIAGCGKSKPAKSTPSGSSSQSSAPISVSTDTAAPAPAPSAAPGASPDAPLVPIAAATTDEKPPDLDAMSRALAQYVAHHYMDPSKLTEADLQKMVKEGFVKPFPPAPAGKKYVWSKYLEVSLANK